MRLVRPGTELRRFMRSRLSRAAIVVAVLIPLLYGALYLWAFWNPTGHLDHVPVALVNLDEGARTSDGEPLDAGTTIADTLVEKDNLEWQVTSPADASQGLEAGRYFAVLTIPADFSKAVATAGGEHPVQAPLQVTYDDANGYTARTIIASVMREIRASVTATIGEDMVDQLLVGVHDIRSGLVKAADGAQDLADGTGTAATNGTKLADGADQVHAGATRLAEGIDDANAGAHSLATGASTLADKLDDAETGSRTLTAGAGTLADGADSLATGLPKAAKGAKKLSTGATKLATGATSLQNGLDTLADKTATLPSDTDKLATGAQTVADGNAALATSLDRIEQGMAQLQTATKGTPYEQSVTQLASGIAQASTGATSLKTGSASVAAGTATLADSADALSDGIAAADQGAGSIADGADTLSTGATTLATKLTAASTGATKLAEGADTLAHSSATLTTGLHKLSTGADELATGASTLDTGLDRLASGSDDLATATKTLADGADRLSTGLTRLDDGAGTLATKLADAVADVPSLSTSERTANAEVMANPVSLDSRWAHEAASNGEGLAPYFIGLALYVGALILWMILRPLAQRSLAAPVPAVRVVLASAKPAILLGVAQAGALLVILYAALGLRPAHLLAFALFAMLVSAAFVTLQQLLTILLGPSVGRLAILVLLMLQLTSAGGTYPAITSAGFFQVLHRVLPMTQVVNGMREAITGDLNHIFWTAVVSLVSIVVASLALSTWGAYRNRVWSITRLHPDFSL